MGESLDKYIGFLIDQGSVIRDFLAEPESPDRIRSDLAERGLTASPDVVDWFTRINGLNKRFRGFLVFADHSPYSFSQALPPTARTSDSLLKMTDQRTILNRPRRPCIRKPGSLSADQSPP